MSRSLHQGERRIRVHGVRKDPPDLRRLARALIELAQVQSDGESKPGNDGKGQADKQPVRHRTKSTKPNKADNGDAA
jgi:hypothetical protein